MHLCSQRRVESFINREHKIKQINKQENRHWSYKRCAYAVNVVAAVLPGVSYHQECGPYESVLKREHGMDHADQRVSKRLVGGFYHLFATTVAIPAGKLVSTGNAGPADGIIKFSFAAIRKPHTFPD